MANTVLRFGHRVVAKALKKFNQVLCGTMMALDKDRQNFVFENDYIRASSLELIANEIYDKNIDGNVAELGVYRGNFAKIINVAFPDRKLYLFDTFEGFDRRDVNVELKNNYSTGEQNFSNTSVEFVLKKMRYKKNCIIRKGFFPDTIKGEGSQSDLTNEKYAFVSIDVDLYEPMYKGLQYFYENLNHGGYIMLHDYNNKEYNGVKAALRKFSKEYKISYFPICDSWGSAVLMKPL